MRRKSLYLKVGLALFAVGAFMLTTNQVWAGSNSSKVYKYDFHTETSGAISEYKSSAVVNKDGIPAIAYYADSTQEGGTGDVTVLFCASVDCPWDTNVSARIATTLYDVEHEIVPDIALDSNDLPRIVYYDPETLSIQIVLCVDSKCQQGRTTQTVALLSNMDTLPASPKIVLDQSDKPIIVYSKNGVSVQVVKCADSDCTSVSDPISYDTTLVNSLNTVSVFVDSNNLPVISFGSDDSADYARVGIATCEDVACTTAVVSVVDAAGKYGDNMLYYDMVLNKNNQPIIAYYEGQNKALKLARCSDKNCASVKFSTIKKNVKVGSGMSMVVSSNNKIKISYANKKTVKGANIYSLHIVHCMNKNCTNNSDETVDSSGSVGTHSSIVLDKDGLPFVSYFDLTNKAFKVAKATKKAK